MTTYTVSANDNLTKIAKKYNTTVDELVSKNKIKDPNKIFIGQKLVISEPKPQAAAPETQEELTGQLEAMQLQLNEMQAQIQEQSNMPQNAGLNGWEVFGLGLGAYAVGKGAEKAMPYVIDGGKVAYNTGKQAAVNGSQAVAKGVQSTKRGVAGLFKHAAKKAELEYAFAKDAVKTGFKNAGKAVVTKGKHIAKGAELEYAFAKDAVKTAGAKGSKILKFTKAGKLLGKAAVPVAVAVSAIEINNAYKEEGTKGAVKQGTKCASGLACAAAGAKVGALIGACTGPAAVVAVPVLTVVGSVAGYLGGEKLASKVISWFE